MLGGDALGRATLLRSRLVRLRLIKQMARQWLLKSCNSDECCHCIFSPEGSTLVSRGGSLWKRSHTRRICPGGAGEVRRPLRGELSNTISQTRGFRLWLPMTGPPGRGLHLRACYERNLNSWSLASTNSNPSFLSRCSSCEKTRIRRDKLTGDDCPQLNSSRISARCCSSGCSAAQSRAVRPRSSMACLLAPSCSSLATRDGRP